MSVFQPKLLPLCVLSVLSMNAVADSQTPHVVLDPLFATAERQVKQSLGVSTINETDLERTPIKNDISEIVRKMPGVNLTGNSATGQRGNNRQIDIRGMGPENTLILVDGKPITSRNSVRYGWRGERDTRGDLQWIPANAIEKIEVMRGPSAARYGNGAMGGVVNIITKKVSNELTGSAEIYTNQPENSKEGDSHRISANISGAIIPDTLGFRLYGSFNKTDMDATDINPLVPYYNANGTTHLARAAGREGVENKDVGVRLAYQINPHHSLTLDSSYGRQGNKYSGDTQHSNRDATSNSTNSSAGILNSNALLNRLIGTETNIMHRNSHSLTHEGTYAWGESRLTAQYDQTKNTRLDEGLAGGPEGVIRNADFETSKLNTLRLHGESILPMTPGIPQKLTLGAEYVKDTLHENANMDEGTSTGTDPNALYAPAFVTGDRSKMTSQITSVYAEDNLQLTNNTHLVLALRYDHHNKSGSNISPAINLSHHLNEHWTLKAGIAKAYKAPNLYQSSPSYLLGTRGNGCPIGLVPAGQWCVLQGNDHLKPETAINSELGFQFKKDNINASLTYFHSDYKDKINAGTTLQGSRTLPYTGANGKTTNMTYNLLKWENIPKAVVEGMEGNLTWTHGGIRLTNNLTYMIKSVDKRTNNPLSLIPTYTWNATFGYDVSDLWDINATYTQYGRQKSRQFAENNIENHTKDGLLHNKDIPSYGIFSVNTGYRFNDHISGRIGINNVFDKQKLRDSRISQTYNEAGRSYFASLKYEF